MKKSEYKTVYAVWSQSTYAKEQQTGRFKLHHNPNSSYPQAVEFQISNDNYVLLL